MSVALEGKNAVVTGCGQGLGQAMTVALAEAGANIIGIDIKETPETQKLVEGLGRKFTSVLGDFSKPEGIQAIAQKAIAACGRVDILLNNAGVTPIAPASEYSPQAFDLVMNINVKSLFFLTQAIGNHMIENKYGKIINICSVQSMKGGNNVSGYVASKHAVAGITRSFANEWGKYGITVNGIAPGYMVTANTEKLRQQTEVVKALTAQIPAARWGQPEDLKGPVVFLASDASAYVNGHLLVVDGGYMNN